MPKFKVGDIIRSRNSNNIIRGRIEEARESRYIITPLEVRYIFTVGKKEEIPVWGIDHDYELDAVSVAIKQFDKELEELLK